MKIRTNTELAKLYGYLDSRLEAGYKNPAPSGKAMRYIHMLLLERGLITADYEFKPNMTKHYDVGFAIALNARVLTHGRLMGVK